MNALDPVAAAPAAAPTRAFQIRISRGLLLGFGGLVFLAVVIVLSLGLWSAWRNTIELLREKSESTIGVVVARIEHYLDPAEYMLKHLGRQLETGAINPDDPAALGHYLSGALAATPQVRSVVFIAERGQMTFALRREEGVDLQLVDVRGLPVLRAALDEARARRTLYWGDVIHPETARETLINVRYPVWRGTSYLGVLGATVRSVELARLLDDTARDIGGEAFVLYGDDQVLAHRKFLRGRFGLGPAHPLPTVAEVGDTIVAQFVATGLAGRAPRLTERATGVELVRVEGEDFAVIARTVDRYGAVPWRIGVSFPAADVGDELRRLTAAAIAGGVVLAVALLVALLFARYLSGAINRIATAAQEVRELALDRVMPVPASVFRELTEAAQAFNTMVVGLRWFENYVPKKLVQRLMHQGDAGMTQSVIRDVTVMFTDIVGFTAHSETMTAEATAKFLNEHFAAVGHCIEDTGGTIDKFIGDAVMAFWGAPEAQPDHAARAVRSALAIRGAVAVENATRSARGDAKLAVRIGIHSGEVIVGNIGAPGRINYTIVGDTVNIAARLEQLGKELVPGDTEVAILASADTIARAGSAFTAAPGGRHAVRGRRGEIDVFVL